MPTPAGGWRVLKFPDDTQARVKGLDAVLSELYAEGKEPNDKAAEEIIRRLKDNKNYIPSSERAHREYSYVLLKEYRKYIKEQIEKNK